MKYLENKLVLVMLIFSLLSSCAKEDIGIYFDESNELNDVEVTYIITESEILELVNRHNESQSLKLLKPLNVLSNTELAHTNYKIEEYKIDLDIFENTQESLALYIQVASVGENVSYDHHSEQEVVNAWISHAPQRALIENWDYPHFGIITEMSDNGINFSHKFLSNVKL